MQALQTTEGHDREAARQCHSTAAEVEDHVIYGQPRLLARCIAAPNARNTFGRSLSCRGGPCDIQRPCKRGCHSSEFGNATLEQPPRSTCSRSPQGRRRGPKGSTAWGRPSRRQASVQKRPRPRNWARTDCRTLSSPTCALCFVVKCSCDSCCKASVAASQFR